MSESARQVNDVFVEAIEKYAERNAVYQDGWKEASWNDLRLQMKHKMGRILRQDWSTHEDLDDAIDLLVYTAFFVIQVREGVSDDKTSW